MKRRRIRLIRVVSAVLVVLMGWCCFREYKLQDCTDGFARGYEWAQWDYGRQWYGDYDSKRRQQIVGLTNWREDDEMQRCWLEIRTYHVDRESEYHQVYSPQRKLYWNVFEGVPGDRCDGDIVPSYWVNDHTINVDGKVIPLYGMGYDYRFDLAVAVPRMLRLLGVGR